jgi:hypothetical protein
MSNDFFEQEYQQYRIIPSDINENLHYLYELALTCNHVTEMGVREGISTRAFLNTNAKLISYDFLYFESVHTLFENARQYGKDVEYKIADVRTIEIEETELLFIDTWHCYEQLKTELALHNDKVKKYIILHDTQTYGLVAEDNYVEKSQSGLGVLPAIIEFMCENPQWRFKKHLTNNNGLTIIERIELPQLKPLIEEEKTLPIPVIGVPIVNGFHWLERLVNSIDYPVDELCVINNNGRGELDDDLYFLSKQKHEFIGKITICTLPSNIGCAGAWNLIIKSYLMKPYWVICNHDIAFTPGYLKEMAYKSNVSNVGMVFSAHQEWCLFLIKDWVVQNCGLFDENLYPAYCEDADYSIRIKHLGIETAHVSLPYLHGDKGYEESGSQTWRTEDGLYPKIRIAHDLNHEYMAKKWGDEWKEKYWDFTPTRHPFNNESMPLGTTTYDLEFLRAKHLGF